MSQTLAAQGDVRAAMDTKHPLEPLDGAEVAAAVAILRASGKVGHQARFASVVLHEPPKDRVLAWGPGTDIAREAFAQVLDGGEFAEAVVSLTGGTVARWTPLPGLQPPLLVEEMFECERVVRADPDFRAALARRGVTDMSLVMVDVWGVGHYGDEPEEEARRRMARTITMVRADAHDNGYARPVENLTVWVDLHTMRVARIEDTGVIPLPPEPGNYAPDYVKEFGETGDYRKDVRPISITQPDGPSFRVNGHEVQWQKWSFRIGFTPREGLVLYTVGYEDGGRVRPILYRASLSEMVVPYGDPWPVHARKNAFDLGEYGVGVVANALELGCDCLGEIKYFDAYFADSRGEVLKMPNVVCMHEEDYGILWKHVDWRSSHTEVRRSRRLVVSFIATVSNYEYGFFWYFYQDGTIQYEVKLTGILSTGALAPGETRKYGVMVAPQLYAPHHQHFFNVRLDISVDGPNNSVYEVHTEMEAPGPDNPDENAFYPVSTLLATEQEAQQMIDPLRGRYWKVVNPHVTNAMGQPVSYKLLPGENVGLMVHPESSVARRARFMGKHLWVTPYAPTENFAAGDYPNQNPEDTGLGRWTQADRPVADTDVVVWYTFGAHHIVRPEDWPVMPTVYIGFHLKPVGFFDRSPALDVPPTPPAHCRG